MFEDGVASYVTLKGMVENNFPVDRNGSAHVTCAYCRFYSQQSNKCRLTEEIIYGANKYIGHVCPLGMEEEHEQVSSADGEGD